MDGDLAPYFAGKLAYNGHTYAGDIAKGNLNTIWGCIGLHYSLYPFARSASPDDSESAGRRFSLGTKPAQRAAASLARSVSWFSASREAMGTVVVSMHRSSCAIENSPSPGSRFPRRFVFIVGSGHSGSTVLAMILGAHPEILALREIAFFDRWIELNQLCNCGVPVRSCLYGRRW
jgi:hypothetical protein